MIAELVRGEPRPVVEQEVGGRCLFGEQGPVRINGVLQVRARHRREHGLAVEDQEPRRLEAHEDPRRVVLELDLLCRRLFRALEPGQDAVKRYLHRLAGQHLLHSLFGLLCKRLVQHGKVRLLDLEFLEFDGPALEVGFRIRREPDSPGYRLFLSLQGEHDGHARLQHLLVLPAVELRLIVNEGIAVLLFLPRPSLVHGPCFSGRTRPGERGGEQDQANEV